MAKPKNPYYVTEENKFLRQMVNMGLFGYTDEQIIDMMDLEDVAEQFTKDLKTIDHPVWAAYKKGQNKRLLQFDQNLLNAATKGNLKAQEELEGRIAMRERKRN